MYAAPSRILSLFSASRPDAAPLYLSPSVRLPLHDVGHIPGLVSYSRGLRVYQMVYGSR